MSVLPTATRLVPGTIFARDYRIVRPLREGGMGAVHVAEQLSTGKQRALKVMLSQLAQDPRFRERFAMEARVGAKIESDHVVEVVGAGVDDATGTPWLAMELLQGRDLGALLPPRGKLPPGDVLEIFRQLCHALAAAHRVGLVHRDLKPENVFVARSRRDDVAFTVKVLDFGIAKVLQESRSAATATAAMGSPLWMAPEQMEAAGRISPATDVWPLGLIAFRLLTGRYYWVGANVEVPTLHALLREICLDPIVPASARAAQQDAGGALPAGFDAWFARCVAREPAARFREAGEALRALVPVLAPQPAASPLAATVYAPPPPPLDVTLPVSPAPRRGGRS